MNRSAQEILEDARKLPPNELDWLIESLANEGPGGMSEEEFAAWQKEAGEPEPGYDEWLRAGVEEALADTSQDTPHEEVTRDIANVLLAAREAHRLKAGV
jgi:hypothetical protein